MSAPAPDRLKCYFNCEIASAPDSPRNSGISRLDFHRDYQHWVVRQSQGRKVLRFQVEGNSFCKLPVNSSKAPP
jgi:hypothetical protein